MNIGLYCNCYKHFVNKRNEYEQKNLMLGSISYEPKLKATLFQKGFIFDDTGDNISHLNYWFGQLTGLYWVWKNSTEEIVGTNTYRIYWGDYFTNKEFKSNTLYIPEPLNINSCFRENQIKKSNLYEQYSYCHGQNNLELLKILSQKNQIQIGSEMIENLKNEYLLYACNMFISERKIFNKICEILFDILFSYYNSYKHLLKQIEFETRQNRVMDFLGERILHMIYTNLDHYISGVNIVRIPLAILNHHD